MDGGPRVPRPTDRRVAARPNQPASRQPAAAAQSIDDQPATHRVAAQPLRTPIKEEKALKRWILPIVVSIVVIVLAAIGWFVWSQSQKTDVAIDSSKYQAVFFTNGQVYFGKLATVNGDYMKLTDIYYLQTQATDGASDQKNPQQTATNQNNVQLVKLGDEVHGPEDAMVISKQQMLFYENLKTDGKVAQSIKKHQEAK